MTPGPLLRNAAETTAPELHAEAHDAQGGMWLLQLRVLGATSIWRAGHRIAALPWRPVAQALHRARAPSAAAAEVTAMLAHQLGAQMTYEIADVLAAQIAAWLQRNWIELTRIIEA